jgi:hypothetical protein
MRWYLYIPSILVLLTLGVELCTSHGASEAKGPSSLACVLDDDDVELKQDFERENTFTECDSFLLSGVNLVIQRLTSDFVLSLEGVAIVKVCSGVRRHRWLCKECC